MSTITEREQRWREFLAPTAAPGFLFHVDYSDPECPTPSTPSLWPDKIEERIERAWTLYETQRKKAEWVNDDRVPYLTNVTGTEIFAEAFGCAVQRPDDTNPFALPCVHNAQEADALTAPELSTSSLAYLFDIADELQRRAGPEAVMKPVDIQSPMDVVALIWEKVDLFIAMLETPESVKRLAGEVRTLLIAFMDEWFRRYGTEYIAHFPDYFMSGGITLSEDEIGAVSEEMFDAFFRNELELLSAHFGGIAIHCCADARHQWGNLKSIPGLRLLNLVKPPTRGAEYIQDAYTFFGGGVAQMHHGWTPWGEPETWPQGYPSECRVVLQCPAATRDEAISLADQLQEIRG
ncbi:MAG: hypothetical protein HN742_02095 [Lentisphaerae bacterium]|jgi:hypothetical protein|nr:hypothetical protein [Lentisphaerota bacterium]MBT4819249.1 hypothetical protein [Lentisphaerota bacterium]MBT5610222.1 hypothetical protein [Lentisphaerota bacterium]MBT7060042.1 hypothetical protein [Lentisphaerota bacterium]MBT7840628.1 hypothetical protein [Lentisphaerota bacterium]